MKKKSRSANCGTKTQVYVQCKGKKYKIKLIFLMSLHNSLTQCHISDKIAFESLSSLLEAIRPSFCWLK